MKRLSALLPLVAVLTVGCSSDPSPTSWNTLGVVTSVERSAAYQAESDVPPPSGQLTYGRKSLTVGPMTVGLSSGETLDVSESTPGGNACVILLTTEERRLAVGGTANPDDAAVADTLGLPNACVIIGTSSGAHLDRFEVLDTTPDGLAVTGDILRKVDSTYLTTSGYAFPLADDYQISCPRGVTLDDVVDDREDSTLVDPSTGEITLIGCILDA